jgi:hypothetical protein
VISGPVAGHGHDGAIVGGGLHVQARPDASSDRSDYSRQSHGATMSNLLLAYRAENTYETDL